MTKRQRKKRRKKQLDIKRRMSAFDGFSLTTQSNYEDLISDTGIQDLVVGEVVATILQHRPADWDQIRSSLDGFHLTPDLLECGGKSYVEPGKFTGIGKKVFVVVDGNNVEIDGYAVGTFVPERRRIDISVTAIVGCQLLNCRCDLYDAPPCIRPMAIDGARDLVAHELGHAFDYLEHRQVDLSNPSDIIASEERANAKSKQWGFRPWLGTIEVILRRGLTP